MTQYYLFAHNDCVFQFYSTLYTQMFLLENIVSPQRQRALCLNEWQGSATTVLSIKRRVSWRLMSEEVIPSGVLGNEFGSHSSLKAKIERIV